MQAHRGMKMTPHKSDAVELADQISMIRNKVSLATMAVVGWKREGARPEGITGLIILLDEAHAELDALEDAIHPGNNKAVEN